MAADWEPPRCVHGHIVLGCPRDDCPTQGAYLDQQEAAMAAWEQRQQFAARQIVRSLLWPEDTSG
jgi:hypothetical protein